MHRFVEAMGCVMLAAMAVSAAQAQVETVTVTAQKRSQDIQSVPISITAFSASDIRDRKLEFVADLATQVPGLEMGELGAVANISMRGIGLSTLSGDGEGSVAINLDDVYLAQPQAALMLQDDLGGVEVLAGPQSTLYGKNAIAGVINLTTPSPTSDLEGHVRASYGDYNAYSVAGDISGPLSNNTTARIFVSDDAHSGYIQNLTTGKDTDYLNGVGGDASLNSQLSANISLEVRAHARYEIFGGPVYGPYNANYLPLFLPNNPFVLANYVALNPQQTRGIYTDHSDRGLYGGSVKLTVGLEDADFISITGFNQFDLAAYGDGLHITVPGISVLSQRYQTFNTVTQEFDLRSRGSQFQWLLGGYFLYEGETLYSPVTLPGEFVDTHVKSSTYNYSIFADAQYPLADHTRAYGGVRVFEESQTFGITNATNGVSACSVDDPYTRSTRDWAGRLGIQQDVGEQVMLYGQISRGYKSGDFGSAACDDEYSPEKNTAFEVGLKSAWYGNRLIFNAAMYHYNYRDLQVETDIPTGLLFVNAPKSEVDGGEISVRAVPVDRLSLDLGLSLLDARYTELAASNLQLIAIGLETPGESLAGNPLDRAPRRVITLGAQYTILEFNDIGSVTARGEVKFSDKFALTEANSPATTQPAYNIANFFLTYTDPTDRYSVRAYVKNATDQHVLGGVLSFYGLEGSYGPPRTFGVELSASLP